MKHSPTPSSQTRALVVNLGTTSLEHAVSILRDEKQFELLSFDSILSICAAHEEIGLAFLQDQRHWPLLDGLVLSMLGEKKVNIAKFILMKPALRCKLIAVDLVRLGQLPEIAQIILDDPDLYTQLNSMQLASLGENDATIANKLYVTPELLSRINKCDLWRFCRKHRDIVASIINNKAIVNELEGSDLAKIIELHESLILDVLSDQNSIRDKQLDPHALVILGRQFESVARLLTTQTKFRDRLGPLGISRVTQHHEKLSFDLLEDLSGNCLAQIAEIHESVVHRIFNTRHLRQRLNLDELVIMGKHHLSIAQEMMKDQDIRNSLSGQQLVILGQAHVFVAHDILQDNKLKQKALGKNIGLLGLKDDDLANLMMNDLSLRECVQQLDLANLSKNFSFITQIVIHDESLFKKVSVSYQKLLRERQDVVIALSTFVQRTFSQSFEASMTNTFLPLHQTSVPLPVPPIDTSFVLRFQSMRI